MCEDLFDNSLFLDKSYNSHSAIALWTNKRIGVVNLFDKPRPVLPERLFRNSRLHETGDHIDLLYSSYSEKLLAAMKNSKNISEYKSENLMNMVIEKVLSLPEFQSLDRVIHQPLKMLIKDPIKLNDDECKYAMNILTHTDFVIFNKLDKMPVLVVEVDGYTYHANNPKQLERDKMKDDILQKYDIPILRIKTNESGEQSKLRQKLMQILKLES